MSQIQAPMDEWCLFRFIDSVPDVTMFGAFLLAK